MGDMNFQERKHERKMKLGRRHKRECPLWCRDDVINLLLSLLRWYEPRVRELSVALSSKVGSFHGRDESFRGGDFASHCVHLSGSVLLLGVDRCGGTFSDVRKECTRFTRLVHREIARVAV